MRNMFSGNSAFTGRGLSQWDTARVGSMFMFSGASAFDADISGWDLTRASAMGGSLTGASSLSDCNKNKIAEAWTRKSKYYQRGAAPSSTSASARSASRWVRRGSTPTRACTR